MRYWHTWSHGRYLCDASGYKPTEQIWTIHDREGVLNACEHCADPATVRSLQELQAARMAEDAEVRLVE